MATALGVHVSTVSRVLNGDRPGSSGRRLPRWWRAFARWPKSSIIGRTRRHPT
nr:hypothetical protein [Pseudomonas brassicae]